MSELEVRIGSMQHAEPGFSIHPRGELRNKETMSRAGWHSNLSKCSRTYYTNCAENCTENIEFTLNLPRITENIEIYTNCAENITENIEYLY